MTSQCILYGGKGGGASPHATWSLRCVAELFTLGGAVGRAGGGGVRTEAGSIAGSEHHMSRPLSLDVLAYDDALHNIQSLDEVAELLAAARASQVRTQTSLL